MTGWKRIDDDAKQPVNELGYGPTVLLGRHDGWYMIGMWSARIECWDDGETHSNETWPTHYMRLDPPE